MAKMRHNCGKNGCYLKVLHAPIHLFDGCFGGSIEMMDIDGTVERNGHFLHLEWKTLDAPLHKGQRIYFERRTQDKHGKDMAYVVWGPVNPEDATALHCIRFWKGETVEGAKTLGEFKEALRQWYTWADKKPQPPIVA